MVDGSRRRRRNASGARACSRPSWRSSTPGTRAGCVGPAATTRSPMRSSSPSTASLWLLEPPTSEAAAVPVPGVRASSRCRSPPRRWATRAARSMSCRRWPSARSGRARAARWPSARPRGRRSREAEAALRAARAFYYKAIEEAWARRAVATRRCRCELRTRARLAATHAVRTAADVARAMYDLGGGSAIYEDSPLQRRFRDAHAATAHFQVNPATWELCRTPAARPAHRHAPAVSRLESGSVMPVLAGPPRRGGRRDRRGRRARRLRHDVGRRDGDVRRLRAGHRRRPADRARAPEDRAARDRRPQPRRDRARRVLGRDADRPSGRRRARRVEPGDRQRLARPPVDGARRAACARASRRCGRCSPASASTSPARTSALTASSCAGPQPDASITVAAFGPADDAGGGARSPTRSCSTSSRPSTSRPSARGSTRRQRSAGRSAPGIAVWVPAALDPGRATLAQLAGQLAVYLRRARLRRDVRRTRVRRARRPRPSGCVARRSSPRRCRASCSSRSARSVSAEQIAARIAAYHDAGADHVGDRAEHGGGSCRRASARCGPASWIRRPVDEAHQAARQTSTTVSTATPSAGRSR